jgi:hypothetical protein
MGSITADRRSSQAIDPVELEDVEPIDPQPAQAQFSLLPQVLGPTQGNPLMRTLLQGRECRMFRCR